MREATTKGKRRTGEVDYIAFFQSITDEPKTIIAVGTRQCDTIIRLKRVLTSLESLKAVSGDPFECDSHIETPSTTCE